MPDHVILRVKSGSQTGSNVLLEGRTDSDGKVRLLVDTELDMSGATVSATLSGTTSVNVAQYGGVATSLGQKVMTASVPIVVASDQGIFTVSAQPQGTYSVRQVENITVSQNSTFSTRNVDPVSISQGTISMLQAATISGGPNLDSASSVANPVAVGGKVLTGSASYTNGQNGVLQLSAAGYLKVIDQNTLSAYDSTNDLFKFDLKRVGSSSISLGSNSMANSVPVVISNNQSIFTVSASPVGNYTVSHGTNVTASLATNATISIPAGTTLSVDTEFISSASSDGFANPTAPVANSFIHGYNGSTWDRLRTDTTNGLDVDVTRVAGSVSMDIRAVSGSNIKLGSTTSAASFPVVIASDQAVVSTRNDSGVTISGWSAGTTAVVDSELGAASASSDNFVNPTAPGVLSFPHVFDGSTWDRLPGSSTTGLSASIAGIAAGITLSVDSELPVASASADNFGNPTAPGVLSFPHVYDGTNWDRLPGSSTTGLSASIAGIAAGVTISTDILNQPIQVRGNAITTSFNAGVTLSTSPIFPVGTTLSVDTEFGAASASANGFANPTSPGVLGFRHDYDNNTWNRHYDGATFSVVATPNISASSNSADLNVANLKGGQFFLTFSHNGGTSPTLDIVLQGKDRLSGAYYGLATYSQKTNTTGSDRIVIWPGIATISNRAVSEVLPTIIRAAATLAGTEPTYSFTISFEGKA